MATRGGIGKIRKKDLAKTNVVYQIKYPKGKKYIGQTTQPLGTRMQQHSRAIQQGYGDGEKLTKYYQNHALKKAKVKVLYHGRSGKYLDQKETALIKKHNTKQRGLNSQKGNRWIPNIH